jgi:hypothetical protein
VWKLVLTAGAHSLPSGQINLQKQSTLSELPFNLTT